MLGDGGSQKEVLRPDFNRSILVDFRGARISSDAGFLLLREMDERFDIIGPMSDCLEDRRSPVHTKHSLNQMNRQRVYQIAAGYEDCNDANYLRIDPALRLAIGKGHNDLRVDIPRDRDVDEEDRAIHSLSDGPPDVLGMDEVVGSAG